MLLHFNYNFEKLVEWEECGDDNEFLCWLEDNDLQHWWIENPLLKLPPASGVPGFDTVCWLGGMPHAEKVAWLLKALCLAFQPPMEKRNLSVFRLEEFYSVENKYLDGTCWHDVDGTANHKLQIRLRSNTRIDIFYDWAYTIVNMLHGLAHFGSKSQGEGHCAKFWSTYDELEADFFKLQGQSPGPNYIAYK